MKWQVHWRFKWGLTFERDALQEKQASTTRFPVVETPNLVVKALLRRETRLVVTRRKRLRR